MTQTTRVQTERRGMAERIDHAVLRASDLPLAQIADPAAIALIRRTEGPSYRPVGAAMVFGRDGGVAGHLSSGCIDADIALHAREVIGGGAARELRYGAGSPFPDLVLPCGGGLDVRIMPVARAPVAALRERIAARMPADLWISAGRIGTDPFPGADFRLRILPDIRFIVFGKGPEAVAFSRMTAGAGYETFLSSPDDETLALAGEEGIRPLPFPFGAGPAALPADRHTAVTLFFHDHDHEPGILLGALASEAFYIGAQGSRRTAAQRLGRLRAMGVDEAGLARLRGPMGLIPSTRDPRMLAISVLAEVLAEAAAT
ncbi:XdhC family protein [Pseudogemmobacter humi]|uniref:XdhC and CoxI family protein n=1 Tax=Pseudogemmobacter humi TaxID=2483812 RepID=A0A3P5X1B6_9RHOB|nr:XdhC family protein [Pseudogemmobacter humi]VDC25011.1 XdhC and CoxI family protein [Pseudogemmobacter humi]